MSEYTYRRSFETANELFEAVKAMAISKESHAFHLWSNKEPALLNVYVKEALSIESYQILYEGIGQFRNMILSADTQKEVEAFRNQSLHDGHMNGKAMAEKVFPTNIPGLKLQIVYLEEWWQMMGGGHIGDSKDIWLLNHEKFSLDLQAR